MANRVTDNIKLGLFVIAGLVVMIFSLYMIGRDTNLFGSNYTLKVRFDNVRGLTPGNNVRYAGIQVGTVRKVKLLSDTVIEVSMIIDTKMEKFIHRNDEVSLSTDGLMGNHILNITPSRDGSPLAVEGDLLKAHKNVSTDDMMETLDRTNRNIAYVSEELKTTVDRINSSRALWEVLDDRQIPLQLRNSLAHIRKASADAEEMMRNLNEVIAGVKEGRGSLGRIISDTTLSSGLDAALQELKNAGGQASKLAADLSKLTNNLDAELNNGKGTMHALLKDTALAARLGQTLQNIEKGTASFEQNMEALKHNFLFRGYFRKLERRQGAEINKRGY